MKLVDANVLVYAVNADAALHEVSRDWLNSVLSARTTLYLPWASLLAFIRISTNARIASPALSADDALQIVEGWLARTNVVCPEPDLRHPQRMRELLAPIARAGGNIVNDAHLAALAVQYGATVVTFDSDFGRFPGVKWEQPSTV